MISNILFLCRGNLCRSPMAAALFGQRRADIRVRSAGLAAVVGEAASPEVVELMKRRGIDVSTHRAAQITRSSCIDADLILVMSEQQKNEVESKYPFTCGKVFLLRAFDGVAVADPYDKPFEAFERCSQSIDEAVTFWTERLSNLGDHGKVNA